MLTGHDVAHAALAGDVTAGAADASAAAAAGRLLRALLLRAADAGAACIQACQ